MIGTENLTFEVVGHTAIVTMNRPEAKNALSLPMLVGMVDAWDEIDANDAIRWKALLRHRNLAKPLIAAVEGYAVAGGTEILQGTDIRVAGEHATFGLFEVARGLFPLGGSTVRLRRQIPYTVAMDILLTGRPVPATEAKEIGLIGHLVPDGTALERALEIAEVICANAPLAVEAVKRSVIESEGMSEVDGLANELEIGWPIFATADAKEGPRAFAEKRPAVFTKQ